MLLLSFFLKESSFVFDSSVLLLLSEVSVVELAVQIKLLQIDSSRGSNHEPLVDSSEGDTVDLIRTSDEQKAARLKLSQENSLSSLERSLKEDDDRARLEGFPETGWVDLKVTVETSFGLFFAVVFGSLGFNDSDFVLVEDLNLRFFRQRNNTRLRLPFGGFSIEPQSPLSGAA